jgi:hypothetical protein
MRRANASAMNAMVDPSSCSRGHCTEP